MNVELEFPCCFCEQPVEEEDLLVAICWVDPHGHAVIAHYLCTAIFDGLPAWPRKQRWLRHG